MTDTTPRHSRRRKICFILLMVLAWIVVLEICLAIMLPAPNFERITISDGEGSQYELSDNRSLIYEPKPNTGEFNSGGYRGQSHPLEKPAGSTRLVMMGDSVAEGLGVTLEERFPEHLAARFGKGYELINLSVRGYNLVQEAAYFTQRGSSYNPDLVIFAITYNDLHLHSGELVDISNRIEKSKTSAMVKAYYTTKGKTDQALLRSNIYRYFRYFRLKKKSFYDSMQYLLSDEEITTIIRDLKSQADEHHFHLSFLFLPVNAPDDQMKSIQTVLTREEIRFLDLHKLMLKGSTRKDWEKLFLPNDPCHLTPAGHKAVTDATWENLAQLLPPAED